VYIYHNNLKFINKHNSQSSKALSHKDKSFYSVANRFVEKLQSIMKRKFSYISI